MPTRSPGEVFTAYAARVNEDLTEGRGPMRTLGVFATRALAVRAVKGQDVMGTDGQIKETQVVMTDSGVAFEIGEVVQTELESDVYERAAKKLEAANLTDEERRVLGLKTRR